MVAGGSRIIPPQEGLGLEGPFPPQMGFPVWLFTVLMTRGRIPANRMSTFITGIIWDNYWDNCSAAELGHGRALAVGSAFSFFFPAFLPHPLFAPHPAAGKFSA